MQTIKLTQEYQAQQWNGQINGLPEGFHLCRPEVHWSADRKFVYFTYAELRPDCWIGMDELPEDTKAGNSLASAFRVELQDGRVYCREALPFAFWSVKSEASLKRDHRAVFIDFTDAAQIRAFADYAYTQGWPNPLPPRVEFREVDGGCGRGYRPHYLKPTDWLIRDGKNYRVITDAERQKLAG